MQIYKIKTTLNLKRKKLFRFNTNVKKKVNKTLKPPLFSLFYFYEMIFSFSAFFFFDLFTYFRFNFRFPPSFNFKKPLDCYKNLITCYDTYQLRKNEKPKNAKPPYFTRVFSGIKKLIFSNEIRVLEYLIRVLEY